MPPETDIPWFPLDHQLGPILPWALYVLVPIVLLLAWRWRKTRTAQLPLPPMPNGNLIIGNMVDVMGATKKRQQHLLMHGWAKEFGEVYRVRVGPFTEYFLNSDRIVKALFDKASAQTADRPRWIVSNEQICNRLNVLLLNAHDPRWKHQRKVIHTGLTSIPQANAGLPFLHFETAKFLVEIASDPEKATSSQALWASIGRYTYSNFATQIFGMEIPSSNNPAIEYIFETGFAQILGTLPGYYIVDLFPWLDRLPLFLKPWERQARTRFQRDWAWCQEKLQASVSNCRMRKSTDLRQRVRRMKIDQSSDLRTSFLNTVLYDEKNLGFESVGEAAYLALQLVIGAADTSRMSTWSFLEAMMAFPEVQKKAQAAIDEVVKDRLPLYSDLEHIPYVRCLMKEVWRWRPPVSLGHPHTTSRELIYNGFRIPKGARLHLNAWAIGHDPHRHPSPERFWPERFANDLTDASDHSSNTQQSINSSDVSQRDHFAFGSGRRVCPGYHVAERGLAVAVMRLLWTFDIGVRPGTALPLNPALYPSEMPGNPGENLPVTLKVRSQEKMDILEKEFQAECARRPAMESLMPEP